MDLVLYSMYVDYSSLEEEKVSEYNIQLFGRTEN